MERISMRIRDKGSRGLKSVSWHQWPFRLFVGMSIALVVVAVLIMSVNPGAEGKGKTMLSQAFISEKAGLEIDADRLTSRVIEQKFQIHMEEKSEQMGDIPYVEIWVLNDPFYPLMGEVGDLRSTQGTLSNKEWQMLGYPLYEQTAQTSPAAGAAAALSQAQGSTSAAVTTPQRVVMVKEIYEIRGIRYATIDVNDNNFDKLKVGSEFAEVFRVEEIKDNQTILVLCGDETYELKVNQLRKI
jgi:hypothetical protein